MRGAWDKGPAQSAGVLSSSSPNTRPGSMAFCIPMGEDEVYFEWALCFAKMVKNAKRPYDLISSKGTPVDTGRNTIVEIGLKQGVEWFIWLDSDVCPNQTDWYERLIAHKLPIVSGVYMGKKHEGYFPCAWIKNPASDKYSPLKLDLKDGLYPVDVTGAGFMVVHRSVYERLTPPWYNFTKGRYNDDGTPYSGPWVVSEDFFLCLQAKQKLGIQTVVDFSVKADHLGAFKITPEVVPRVLLQAP